MIFKNLDLDKYNKRLIAVIGTIVSVCVLIVALISIAGVAYDFSRKINRGNNELNDGIVINQNQVIDTTTHSFSQELSILEPHQLDTIAPIFIVPIGQKDQTKKRIKFAQAGMSFSSDLYSKEYQYTSFSGLYNNFVIIDYTRDIQQELFSKKVALTEWAYLKIDSTKLIVIKGTDEDSNEDGRLNDDDFQSLFVFDVNTLESKVLKFKNQTVREFEPLKMTSKIYVRTGRDLNKDNKFNRFEEPTDLYFYDVKTGEHETLIPEKVKAKIQQILNN